ncbi:hypothetical protein MNEG_14838 [Monoraphidium neglectum]|uniref:EF-hand domain-containing protein n=1 Tax=Monoraphidium neglectum TaxID=145388 RepID=A0A0D2LU05_9CHLO|nr:hypothetical protein MNEG_14838 [Monoraphidium neglectum]KIY93126.1 hypothetical protein MNEG_14838 [Monoraphidium neglectum]|eukprot:XP_013892146.1 hypothetical protein MNEG_14838 [Monoraphidium neglectum]
MGPQVAAHMVFTGGSLQSVRAEDEPAPETIPELRAPLALEERVGGILMRIEQELDDAEKTIGERLHVIDLDNDGLISKGELQEALRFLKANLDDEELMSLLDRMNIKAGGGSDQPLISVSDLIKLAEPSSGGSGSSSSSSGNSSSGGSRGNGGGGSSSASSSAAAAEKQPADTVKIHTR